MAKRNKGGIHPILDKTTSRVFHALASDPRRMMLAHLAQSSLTAGEIAARFDMAKPSISQHLSILENAELIEGQKKGQYIHYRLNPPALRQALQVMLSTLEPADTADVAFEAEVIGVTSTASAARPARAAKADKKSAPAERKEKPAKQAKEKVETPEVALPPLPRQMGLLDLLGMEA